jgi:hypothetical protein
MSDYLFAGPSFLEGVGRTIDLFGVMNEYNYSRDGAEADRTALANDIAVLRSDLMESYQGVICEHAR